VRTDRKTKARPMADTEATRANQKRVAMLPFEEAEHCEYFTQAERSAIMAAVDRVKAEAAIEGCIHIGGLGNQDIALYQSVHCSKCGKKLGTVIPTSDGGKTLA